jgi:hypothetical protein
MVLSPEIEGSLKSFCFPSVNVNKLRHPLRDFKKVNRLRKE